MDVRVVFAAGGDIGKIDSPLVLRQFVVTADEKHGALGPDFFGKGDQIVDTALQLPFSIFTNK